MESWQMRWASARRFKLLPFLLASSSQIKEGSRKRDTQQNFNRIPCGQLLEELHLLNLGSRKAARIAAASTQLQLNLCAGKNMELSLDLHFAVQCAGSRFLIVVPVTLLEQWRRELDTWVSD